MNKAGIAKKAKALVQLTKPLVTLSVALTALTGFILSQGFFAEDWLLVTLGVYLLAAGSANLNHLQEAGPDRLMKRTFNRPIPSGKVSRAEAAVFFVILSLAGFVLLANLNYRAPFILGAITLLWYNLVYTWLKRKTAFAVVPGSLVGALPPIIGWTAAGGYWLDPHIILVAFFFFIGQIPHFWLILLRHGNDYEKAGFPTITRLFSTRQIANLTLIWVAATAMAAILPALFGVIRSPLLSMLVFSLALALLWSFRKWYRTTDNPDPQPAFITINGFFLLMMLIFIADALIR
ncbi:MAG: protoheme IX farnesyltransferase [Bacteroides sp.]|jgi:protoheme IX farnesyltransferase|nr:protoheme IX farnesyltransferase [Bacteroides sp.]